MGVIYYCSMLDDAIFFIHQAKGLPDVSSTRPLRDRYIRAGILFSWIALEEMLEYAIDEQGLSRTAPAKPLQRRLDFTLHALGRAPVDARLFLNARKFRNRFTHPIADGKIPVASVDEAMKAFDFCSGLIKNLFNHEVRWGLDDYCSPKTFREKVRLSADRGQ